MILLHSSSVWTRGYLPVRFVSIIDIMNNLFLAISMPSFLLLKVHICLNTQQSY